MQSAMRFLESATAKLQSIGVAAPQTENVPIVGVLERLERIDPDRVLVVARTLQHASYFNEVVRKHIQGVTLADRYADIAQAFTSIRDDAKMLVEHMDDGKVSLKERAQEAWMKFRRGSIEQRFQDIAVTYREVVKESRESIDSETAILSAYTDFRSALKQAEIEAYVIHEQAANELAAVQKTADDASAALEQADGDKARAEAELARDLAANKVRDAGKSEQIAKDLADNLKVSYATGEAVMARLAQSTDVKERVYEQAVSFFGTNETVFTALAATFVSLSGLHESTQTLENMKEGISDSIETLSEVGDEVLMAGTKAGYGPTIRAESVKKLVDSISDYQERTFETTREMRQLATDNAQEISDAVERGKARYSKLMREGGRDPMAADAVAGG